eukprot:TRINITY_DN1195_c0_g2_i1.p1 TRINITY_DN1195_c0_g2~~TRINITY_DN1195_c0_g2_i1.p1  ORF type:complete len:589 (-),score=72.70 TRINITY_DN1195_c0_g2_i1:79-1845(-)
MCIRDRCAPKHSFKQEKNLNRASSQHGPRFICAVCSQGGKLRSCSWGGVANQSDANCDMVRCNECHVAVHASCYGLPASSLRATQWLCDRCTVMQAPVKCVLCPCHGGAFKRLHSDTGWIHVQCAQWTPEVKFEDEEELSKIVGTDKISRDRAKLACSICRKMGADKRVMTHGAPIQCSFYGCTTPFHVTCAQADGLHVRSVGPTEPGEAFCTKHDPVRTALCLPCVGEKRIWDNNKQKPFDVLEVAAASLCAVRFGDDVLVRNIERSCVQLVDKTPADRSTTVQDEDDAETEEEIRVRVCWADGQLYDGTLVSDYEMGMVRLGAEGYDEERTLPAASLANPFVSKSTGHKRKTSTKASLEILKGKDWISYLRLYDGKEVACRSSAGDGDLTYGTLVFPPEGTGKPVISTVVNGVVREVSFLGFESLARNKSKNTKNSVTLVELNISLGQAALRTVAPDSEDVVAAIKDEPTEDMEVEQDELTDESACKRPKNSPDDDILEDADDIVLEEPSVGVLAMDPTDSSAEQNIKSNPDDQEPHVSVDDAVVEAGEPTDSSAKRQKMGSDPDDQDQHVSVDHALEEHDNVNDL